MYSHCVSLSVTQFLPPGQNIHAKETENTDPVEIVDSGQMPKAIADASLDGSTDRRQVWTQGKREL